MKQFKRIMPVVLVLMVFFFLPLCAAAEPEDPGDIPVDGGLSLLLAAGAGYVIKKGRDKRKSNK